MPHDDESESDSEAEDMEFVQEQLYVFDGVKYETYQDMVDAKRKRNHEVLKSLGFLNENSSLKLSAAKVSKASTATQRGIRSKKRQKVELVSRKSSRLSGKKTNLVALDYLVPNWNTDNSVVKVAEGEAGGNEEETPAEPSFFKGRLNGGEDLTLEEAIELNESKWISDDSVKLALDLQKDLVKLGKTKQKKSMSPKSVMTDRLLQNVDDMVNDLSIDNEEWVAKVTPDRIYSVTTHPSESKMIACAGDKQGYVGLWDVDSSSDESNGVHLFHVHSRPICCMEWTSPDSVSNFRLFGCCQCKQFFNVSILVYQR